MGKSPETPRRTTLAITPGLTRPFPGQRVRADSTPDLPWRGRVVGWPRLPPMPELGFNIDHVATLREARYRNWKRGLPPEPNLPQCARVAEEAGADQITVHLREDRRHIQPADVRLLARSIKIPLNLEMAATPEMTAQAIRFKPREVCLVPENRLEITTEGGLNVVADLARLRKVTGELHKVELHTGAYANGISARQRHQELARHGRAAAHAHELGLRVNAGHGLHYTNVREYIEDVPHLHTLNIGHAIVARAVLVGLDRAIGEMLALMRSPEPALTAD
jgi:pyridoxine 5-phosphate synthase